MNADTGKTFKTHLIDLASSLGLASQTSSGLGLPSDAVTLDQLRRKYNEGLQLMVADHPIGWNCLRPVVDITLTTDTTAPQVYQGDISQYRLPWYVQGDPLYGWSWIRPSGTLNGVLESRDWGTITRLLNANRGAGIPQVIATRAMVEHNADGTDQVIWIAKVHPRPNETYIVSGLFNVTVQDLVHDSQRHPFGAIHDMAVLSAAKWAWVKDDSTDARRDQWEKDYMIRLGKAIEIDNMAGPTTGPSMLEGADTREMFRKLPRTMYINGSVLT